METWALEKNKNNLSTVIYWISKLQYIQSLEHYFRVKSNTRISILIGMGNAEIMSFTYFPTNIF